MKKLSSSFQSLRLSFRKPMLSDAVRVFQSYTNDPGVTRFVTWKPHTSVKETIDFLKYCLDKWDEGKELNFLIELRETNDVVGMIKVSFHDTSANLGYVIAKKYWGRGYTTEAVNTLIRLLFEAGVSEVQAFCDVENKASARVMEKAGMTYQKKLPKYILHPNISSEKRDCLSYQISKDQHDQKRTA